MRLSDVISLVFLALASCIFVAILHFWSMVFNEYVASIFFFLWFSVVNKLNLKVL